MKQFCETSFKNRKLSAELTASYQCVLRFFDSTCLNYCACHEKVKPGHAKCCNHLSKPEDLMLQNANRLNQRPDLLTALMNMSLVLRLPRKMHLCRSSSNAPRLPWCLEMSQNSHALLTFDKVHNPLRLPRETTSEPPKVVRTPGAFNVLTSKCASRHNGVHFFDISTSKSGPDLVCFVHFDFEMCAQFFISHLASWLRTRRFSEPTCRPSGATNHWKNTVFRDFPTFSRTWIFFLLRLSLLWSSLFFSSLLYSSAPPVLFMFPYCRKFDF